MSEERNEGIPFKLVHKVKRLRSAVRVDVEAPMRIDTVLIYGLSLEFAITGLHLLDTPPSVINLMTNNR